MQAGNEAAVPASLSILILSNHFGAKDYDAPLVIYHCDVKIIHHHVQVSLDPTRKQP